MPDDTRKPASETAGSKGVQPGSTETGGGSYDGSSGGGAGGGSKSPTSMPLSGAEKKKR